MYMKKFCFLLPGLVLAALLFSARGLSAQTTQPQLSRAEKQADPVVPVKCDNCKHATPVEVHTSTRDAVVVTGPPDGKGAPVEYQIYTQKGRGAGWVLAAHGMVSKPGARESLCFPNTAQVMVLVWCDTPFGAMAEFADRCE